MRQYEKVDGFGWVSTKHAKSEKDLESSLFCLDYKVDADLLPFLTFEECREHFKDWRDRGEAFDAARHFFAGAVSYVLPDSELRRRFIYSKTEEEVIGLIKYCWEQQTALSVEDFVKDVKMKATRYLIEQGVFAEAWDADTFEFMKEYGIRSANAMKRKFRDITPFCYFVRMLGQDVFEWMDLKFREAVSEEENDRLRDKRS